MEIDSKRILGGTWDDIILPMSALQVGAGTPAMQTFTGGIKVFRLSAGDGLYGSFEIPHDYMQYSDMICHIHWSPSNGNTLNVIWDFEYTMISPLGTFPVGLTLTVTTPASGVSLQHQLVNLAPNLTGQSVVIGSICDFHLVRRSGDAFTGNCFVHSVGLHYQKDSLGSNAVTTK
jgi:hypothetical protein